MRGLEIILIRDDEVFQRGQAQIEVIEQSLKGKIAQVLATKPGESQSTSDSELIGLAKRHINEINFFYVGSAFKQTRGNFEGLYRFSEIPPGKYYVYARYQTTANDAHWLVPVMLASGTSPELDLSNHNLTNDSTDLNIEILETRVNGLSQDLAALGVGEVGILEIKLQELETEKQIISGQLYPNLGYPRETKRPALDFRNVGARGEEHDTTRAGGVAAPLAHIEPQISPPPSRQAQAFHSRFHLIGISESNPPTAFIEDSASKMTDMLSPGQQLSKGATIEAILKDPGRVIVDLGGEKVILPLE